MNTDNNHHAKQYRFINGCHVRISFSEEKNPELFKRIREILVSCSDSSLTDSHNCRNKSSNDTMTPSEKEVP